MKSVRRVFAVIAFVAVATVPFSGCQFEGTSEADAVETVEGEVMDGLYSEENLIYGYQ